MRLEHLGIAVEDMNAARELYTRLLGVEPYKEEEVEEQGVNTVFFQTGESKIELLEPTRTDSPIAKYLYKKGEGIHHVAFEVDDIRTEMERLKNEGFQLLSEEPTHGADNKLVCFIHPKSASGVLVELCQSKK